MTREDIIRMARECQFAYYYESGDLVAIPQLERFAALVAAHERDRMCEQFDISKELAHEKAKSHETN